VVSFVVVAAVAVVAVAVIAVLWGGIAWLACGDDVLLGVGGWGRAKTPDLVVSRRGLSNGVLLFFLNRSGHLFEDLDAQNWPT
jgi:hypothetical protein